MNALQTDIQTIIRRSGPIRTADICEALEPLGYGGTMTDVSFREYISKTISRMKAAASRDCGVVDMGWAERLNKSKPKPDGPEHEVTDSSRNDPPTPEQTQSRRELHGLIATMIGIGAWAQMDVKTGSRHPKPGRIIGD